MPYNDHDTHIREHRAFEEWRKANPMHARRSRKVRAWRKVCRVVRQALIGWS